MQFSWFHDNVLDTTQMGVATHSAWDQVFLYVTWHIWKPRNELIFQSRCTLPSIIRHQAATFTQDIQITMEQLNSFNMDLLTLYGKSLRLLILSLTPTDDLFAPQIFFNEKTKVLLKKIQLLAP